MKGEHFAMSCFFWGPRHAAQQKPGFLSLKTGVPSTAAVFIFAARRCEVVREASEIFLCGDTVRGGNPITAVEGQRQEIRQNLYPPLKLT